MSGAKKIVRKIVPKEVAPALPVAAAFIPGVGPLAGAAIGAGTGALTNKNSLKGALLGGVTGGLAGGGAAALTGAAGLSGALGSAAQGALIGGSVGANKGLKGALTGAALGGAGGYLTGGGLSNLMPPAAPAVAPAGSFSLGGTAANQLTNATPLSGTGGFGSAVSKALGVGKNILGGAGKFAKNVLLGPELQGPTLSGAPLGRTGGLARSLLSGSGLLSGLGMGLGGSLLGKGADAYSDYNAMETQKDIEKMLLEAQGQAAERLKPYEQLGQEYTDQIRQMLGSMPNYSKRIAGELDAGTLGGEFTPQDFTQDPGYEFRRQEGEKALSRQLASMGMRESGAAVKRAMEFNQGLADQEYGDAYNRWLEQQQNRYKMLAGQQGVETALMANQQGLGADATNALANLDLDVGDIRAMTARQRSNLLSRALANLFRSEDDNLAFV